MSHTRQAQDDPSFSRSPGIHDFSRGDPVSLCSEEVLHEVSFPINPTRETTAQISPQHDSTLQNYNVLTSPVHSVDPEPNSPTTKSSSAANYVSDNSTSSWHSASEANDHSIKKGGRINDPFLRQMQYLLQEEQKDGRSIIGHLRPMNRRTRDSQSPRAKPAKSDEHANLKKQLEDARIRIADLEARVNSLTFLKNYEEPPDNPDELHSLDQVKKEYTKLKEMKKKAERQYTEARQMTQRVVAENCKLKEELLQEQHANELRTQQMRKLNTAKETQMNFTEKIEMWRSLPSFTFKQAEGPKLTLEAEYQEIEVTPQLLWDVIYNDPATLYTGHVMIAGLPYCYKTTLMKRMLAKDGNPPTFSGDQHHLQMFQAIVHEHPLTKEREWDSAEGLECVVVYVAYALVRHCLGWKKYPVFPRDGPTRLEDINVQGIQDKCIKEHFWVVFQEVKHFIERKKKDKTLVEFALSRHILVNVWDLGVSRALRSIFPGIACYSESLAVIAVCDLERDVPHLTKAPNMTQKDDYSAWNDDESDLQAESRLHYLTLMAGIKQWYRRDRHKGVTQAVIVGVYRKEFGERNNGADLKAAKEKLGKFVSLRSSEMGIIDTIDTNVVAICINEEQGEAAEEVIQTFRKKIETIMLAQPKTEASFPVRYMFLRSLFRDPKSAHTVQSKIRKYGIKCGILHDQSLDECLELCRQGGSVMYFPNLLANPYGSQHIILNVAMFIEKASRLYYLKRFVEQKKVELVPQAEADFTEYYQYGLVTDCLAEAVFGNEAHVFMHILYCGNLCSKVFTDDQEFYFFPSLRTYRNERLVKGSDENALRIEVNLSLPFEFLAIIPRYLDNCFEESNVDIVKSKEFNVFSFRCKLDKEVVVKIIHFSNVAEIRIEGDISGMGSLIHQRLKTLFFYAYHHISDYCPNMEYHLKLVCPLSSVDRPCHYVEFFQDVHETALHCDDCDQLVHFSGQRKRWLL